MISAFFWGGGCGVNSVVGIAVTLFHTKNIAFVASIPFNAFRRVSFSFYCRDLQKKVAFIFVCPDIWQRSQNGFFHPFMFFNDSLHFSPSCPSVRVCFRRTPFDRKDVFISRTPFVRIDVFFGAETHLFENMFLQH
jgi:hypothetical protein